MVGHLLRYLLGRLPERPYQKLFGFVPDYLIDTYTWDPDGGEGLARLREILRKVAADENVKEIGRLAPEEEL